MKATRSITKGNFEFIITVEKKIIQNDIDLDGDIFAGKPELYSDQNIVVKLDGKEVRHVSHISKMGDCPSMESHESFEKVRNAYGYIDSSFGLSESTYNDIKKALYECSGEVTTEEIKVEEKRLAEKKVAQKKADEEEYRRCKRLALSGLCLKCGTWCYGDCEAS